MVVKTGDMLVALPEVQELDLNPIIYNKKRDLFMAADVRIKRG